MKIATWNVNGIRAREAQFSEWLAAEQPDVLCLQEIKASPDQVPEGLRGLPDYWACWHGGAGGYSGVGLFLRRGMFTEEPQFGHPAFDFETRIVEAVAGGTVYTSVYIPNGGKDFDAKIAFLTAMVGYVEGVLASGRELVLCGDMNVAITDKDIHPSHIKPGTIGILPEERELFGRMVAPGLVDVARSLDPDNDRMFTWWPFWKVARQRNLGWRIDYILASRSVASRATSCVVHSQLVGSDHAPVLATFAEQ